MSFRGFNRARFNCALVVGLMGLVATAPAATYYVAESGGDDTRSAAQAQNLATPWKTIQKAASTMGTGNTCLIRAGTYRETVTPQTGQVFENYNGEYVLISGCNVVSSGGWTVHSGNIYKATVSSTVYDVFVDGAYMDKAQYPNANTNRNDKAEWAVTSASFVNSSTTGVIFSNGMNVASGYWNGGWYNGINGNNSYAGTLGNITASSGNTLTLGDVEFRQTFDNVGFFGAGSGYIINHLNCLDVAKEWHWQSSTLYLYAPGGGSPSSKVVEARVRLYGFNVGVNNATIRGLNFKGAAARLAGNNCTVDGCTFRYVSPWGNYRYPGQGTEAGHYVFGGTNDGMSGIHISGSTNTFKNNYVARGWGALVSCRGSYNTIDNNYLEDANWATRGNTVNLQVSGTTQRITRNTLRKSNAMIINIVDMEANQIYKTTVVSNDCRYWGYLNPDGGRAAIYRNGSNDSQGDVYAYNVLAFAMGDDGGLGIYMDDGSQNLTVHHNAIYLNNYGTVVRGIWFHGNSVAQANIFAYNNTCFGLHGTSYNQAVAAYNTGGSYSNIQYKNNLANVNSFQSATLVQSNSGAATASYFVDAANANLRLTASATAAIDKGTVIAGITDGYVGSAPDIGAYERNGPDRTAGSTVTVPSFPDEGGVSAPAAPSGLSASAVSANQINLSWTDNATNETSFRIERKTGAGGAYAEIATPAANATSYNNTGLDTATTYFYRIRASNSGGDSAYSAEASATTFTNLPAAPSGLGAVVISSSQINLSWTDNATNETGFKIERKTGAGGTYAPVATNGPNVTTFNNTGLSASTEYYYRVRAFNAGGDSAYSNETNATTSASSGGGSITILTNVPTADSWVRSDIQGNNYGTATTLGSQKSVSRDLETYLRFAVSGISGKTVTGAVLRLKEGPGGTAGTNNSAMSVRRITGSWTELGVKWTNKPAYDASAWGSFPANTLTENMLVEISLTPTAFTNDGDYDLALIGTSNGNDSQFNSREYATDKPQLVLTVMDASVAPPVMLISRQTNGVLLTWSGADFALQERTNLAVGNWQNSATLVNTNGTNFSALITNLADLMFFRLKY